MDNGFIYSQKRQWKCVLATDTGTANATNWYMISRDMDKRWPNAALSYTRDVYFPNRQFYKTPFKRQARWIRVSRYKMDEVVYCRGFINGKTRKD